MIELKNSKTKYLGKSSGGDKYSLDAFIGAVQMREPEGQWQDIKPRLVRDADGWHIEGAPYYAEIKDDGTRLFCPDRNERSKYLRLPTPALFYGLSKNVISLPDKVDGSILPNQITMPAEWGEIRIIFSNTGMHFEILFTKAPPSAVFGKDSPRILLDAEIAGLDIEQLLQSHSGIGIPRPRLMATNLEALFSESQEKWLDWDYKNGQLELGFDFGNLPFPILLKNTTIDVQVGASADDGSVIDLPWFNNTNEYSVAGWDDYYAHSFYRLTSITIPQSSTINVCYLQLREWESLGNPLTKIYFEKAQNPNAVTSYADYLSRTLTTAGVDWDGDPGADGWYNSPSLVSVMQELINAYGLSNQAIQVMHKDDGSTPSGGNYRRSRTWDFSDHTYGAKLHIEYTAGGATAKTSAETGAGTDGSSLLAAIARGDTASGNESTKSRGLDTKDNGGGADALTALLVAVLAAETGSGVEQSTLTSAVARLSAETGSGIDIAALVASLASGETGTGVDTGWLAGLKNILGSDGGIGNDSLKALIGTSRAASDMKLPGRQGQVRIPSKGVSL